MSVSAALSEELRRERPVRGRRSAHRGDGANVHPPGNKYGRHEEQLRDHSLVHERGQHRVHRTCGPVYNHLDWCLKLQAYAHLHGHRGGDADVRHEDSRRGHHA